MAHPKAGKPLSPRPAKYFAALLFGEGISLPGDALEPLERLFGRMDFTGAGHPFDMTDYYSGEMGGGLKRVIVSFERLRSPSSLVWIKHETARIEASFSWRGKRRINIDPGYVDLFKVVLASFKEGPQKIYLGSGVYADPVLMFEDHEWRVLPWSFPDFREGLYMEEFGEIRRIYREQRRDV